MFKHLDLRQCKWLNTAPAPRRDIRRIYPDFPLNGMPNKNGERVSPFWKQAGAARPQSLRNSSETLRSGNRRASAAVLCWLVSFQIWFVDAALDVHTRTKQRGVPFTYMADEEVDVGQLHTLDWRPLHTILRERISRTLGGDEIVIGMGKVEYDPSRNKWQPYHDFMVYHRRNWNLF